ncbi:MAG: PAS domain S-box protein [Candidatus Thorarchaeota archaeon]|nr:PAS domain S-box protein [Candidatus Thorarchaeota archaeon]
MIVRFVLITSVMFQIASAVLAFRLTLITGNRRSFTLIAAAILLMAFRRAVTLYRLISGDLTLPPDLAAELIALCISVLMLIGMDSIAPLFHAIKDSEEALRDSESRYRMLFETAPIAIVLTDIDGNFIAANEWMEKISDYSRNELESVKAPALYVYEEDRNRVLAKVHETGRLRDFEVELRRKNGTTYHALLNEDLVELEGKKINLATIRDVTDQKRTEEAMRQSEARYKALFKYSPVSIWIEDFRAASEWLDKLRASGVSDLVKYFDDNPEAILEVISLVEVIDVNDATLEIYEVDTREALLSRLNEVLIEVSPEYFKQELLAIWEGKTYGIEFETTTKTLKGNPIQVIVHWRSYAINGKIDLSRVIVAITDITKRKRAEHDLRAAADTAELYLDLMGHDLRNHLQAIVMATEIMKHMDIGADVDPMFELILESVDISQSIIRKMQSTRGLLTAPFFIRPLDVVLNECLIELCATYGDVKVELGIQVQKPLVYADRYLEHLLMNILENAVVHNNKKVRCIWVTVNEIERGYEISISDNGPGLTESEKESLFDPERRFGGVGVHQAISIIRKYGGRILVRDRIPNHQSQGIELLIWLPKWSYSG